MEATWNQHGANMAPKWSPKPPQCCQDILQECPEDGPKVVPRPSYPRDLQYLSAFFVMAEEEYPRTVPPAETVHEYAERWGFDPCHEPSYLLAQQWCDVLMNEKYHASALMLNSLLCVL